MTNIISSFLMRLVLLLSVFSFNLTAATFQVTSSADSGAGSLRQAVSDANHGDTIDLSSIAGSTIILSSSINIDKDLTIQGSTSNPITIDGNSSVRHFIVLSNYTLHVKNLILQNGYSKSETISAGYGGAILVSTNASLHVENTHFTGNVGDNGGAIYFQSGSSGDIVNTSFVSNEALVAYGGAIYNSGSLRLKNSTFTTNLANNAAAVMSTSYLTVDSSTFAHNNSTLSGGAIGVVGDLRIKNNLFFNNTLPNIYKSSGWIESKGFNYFPDSASNSVIDMQDNADIVESADPKLGTLTKSSDGITWGYKLSGDSPLKDAGECTFFDNSAITQDQFGTSRPQNGACDIGAIEYDGADIYGGLVAYYEFEDSAVDSQGGDNDGTATNVSYVSGKFGKAASFNGTKDSKITIDSLVGFPDTMANAPYTISAWINSSEIPSRGGIIGWGSFEDIAEKTNALRLTDSGLVHYWWHHDITTNQNIITKDTWHHVVVTYNGSNERIIYLDGVNVKQDNPQSLGWSLQAPLENGIIGDTLNLYGYSFKGLIDDIKVYTRALNAEDVTQLYNHVSRVTLAAIPDKTLNQDFGVDDITLTTTEASEDSITFSASSSNTSLVTTSISGNTLSLTAVPNAYGNATITVTATQNGKSDTKTFTLNVLGLIDSAPDLDPFFYKSPLDENFGTENISLGATDSDGDTITLSAESNDTTLVTTSLSGTTLTLNSVENAHGIVAITVKASAKGKSDTETFTVTVNNTIDNAPVLSSILSKYLSENFGVENITLNATDADGDSVTFTAESNNTSLITTSISGNTLSLNSVSNATGKANITVTATANGKSDSKTFSVDVIGVVDSPPELGPFFSFSKDEDFGTFTINLSATDPDGDSITFSAESNDTTLVTTSVSGTTLTLSSVQDAHGTATITVTATSKTKSDTGTFTITINPSEENPFQTHIAFEESIENVQLDNYLQDNPSSLVSNPTKISSSFLEYITTTSISGKSGYFDGIVVYTIPNTIPQDFTISFWMKTTENGGGVVGQWYTGMGLINAEMPNIVNDFGLSLTQGKISAGVKDLYLSSTTSVNDNRWHLVTFTREQASGAVKLYIDKVLEGSGSTTTENLSAPNTITIGQINELPSATPYIGLMDELKIYESVLSQTEIDTEYKVYEDYLDSIPITLDSISNQIKNEDFGSLLIVLDAKFEDGYPITYTATSSNTSLVTTSISGEVLTLKSQPSAFGETTITVTASANGKSTSKTFTLKVNAAVDPYYRVYMPFDDSVDMTIDKTVQINTGSGIENLPIQEVASPTSITSGNVGPIRFEEVSILGKSAYFTGYNVYTIPNTIQKDFTISFWMKTYVSGGGTAGQWYTGMGLVNAEIEGALVNDFGLSLTEGKISAGVEDVALVSTTSVNDDAWHFITFTREQSTGAIKLYIDNVLEAQAVSIKANLDASDIITIGKINKIDASVTYRPQYSGYMDELKIYDSLRSESELTAEYNSLLNIVPLVLSPSNITNTLEHSSGVNEINLNASYIAGHPITYSVDVNDTSLVTASISGSTLSLNVVENAHGRATITITASANGQTDSQTYTVLINPIPDDYLATYVDFEDNFGSLTKISTGTLTYKENGVSGKSAYFYEDDVYTMPNTIPNDFTISFWARSPYSSGGTVGEWWTGQGLVNAEMPGVVSDFGISLTQGKISAGVSGLKLSSTTSMNDNEWHMITLTRKHFSGEVKLYIDGVLEDSGGLGLTNYLNASDTITIGQINKLPSATAYHGDIDELKIYNTVLEASDIVAEYERIKTANLVSKSLKDAIIEYETQNIDPSFATAAAGLTSLFNGLVMEYDKTNYQASSNELSIIGTLKLDSQTQCKLIPTSYAELFACALGSADGVFGLGLVDLAKIGIPIKITYEKENLDLSRTISFTFEDIINQHFQTPELAGLRTSFVFNSMDLTLNSTVNYAGEFSVGAELAGNNAFIRPTLRDNYVAITPSVAAELNNKGEIEITIGGEILGECGSSISSSTTHGECTSRWNPLGLGIVSSNAAMLKIGFDPVKQVPKSLSMYVTDGYLGSSTSPINAAIKAGLELPKSSDKVPYEGAIFVYSDEVPSSSVFSLLPSVSPFSELQNVYSRFSVTSSTIENLKIMASTINDPFGDEDFENFQKYFNENLRDKVSQDYTFDKPGFSIKGESQTPSQNITLDIAGYDVVYNVDFKSMLMPGAYTAYNSAGTFRFNLGTSISDPSTLVAGHLPISIGSVCSVIDCGSNSLEAKIGVEASLKNQVGDIATSGSVQANLLGLSKSFDIETSLVLDPQEIANKTADQVCSASPLIKPMCSGAGAVISVALNTVSTLTNVSESIINTVADAIGDFASGNILGGMSTLASGIKNAITNVVGSIGSVFGLGGDTTYSIAPYLFTWPVFDSGYYAIPWDNGQQNALQEWLGDPEEAKHMSKWFNWYHYMFYNPKAAERIGFFENKMYDRVYGGDHYLEHHEERYSSRSDFLARTQAGHAAAIYWQNKSVDTNMYDGAIGSKNFSAPYVMMRYPECNDANGSILFEKAVNCFKENRTSRMKTVPKPSSEYQSVTGNYICRAKIKHNNKSFLAGGFWAANTKDTYRVDTEAHTNIIGGITEFKSMVQKNITLPRLTCEIGNYKSGKADPQAGFEVLKAPYINYLPKDWLNSTNVHSLIPVGTDVVDGENKVYYLCQVTVDGKYYFGYTSIGGWCVIGREHRNKTNMPSIDTYSDYSFVSADSYSWVVPEGEYHDRKFKASDPELFGCKAYVNNIFAGQMAYNESNITLDVQEDDFVSFSECSHYDPTTNSYVPWDGTVSNIVDEIDENTTGETVHVNPITTIISGKIQNQGDTSKEERMEILKEVVEVLVDQNLSELNASSPNVQEQLMDIINKPSNELYTDPIVIKDENNNTVVDVSKPDEDAVAFVAVVATAIESAGMQQEAIEDDSKLGSEQLAQIGGTAFDNLVKFKDTNTTDKTEVINTALEELTEVVTEQVQIEEGKESEAETIKENAQEVLKAQFESILEEVKDTVVNGGDIEQVLIEQSKNIQDSSEIQNVMYDMKSVGVSVNSTNNDTSSGVSSGGGSSISKDEDKNVVDIIRFDGKNSETTINTSSNIDYSISSVGDDYITTFKFSDETTLDIDNKADGKINFSIKNGNLETKLFSELDGTSVVVEDSHVTTSYEGDNYILSVINNLDGSSSLSVGKGGKESTIKVNNKESTSSINSDGTLHVNVTVNNEVEPNIKLEAFIYTDKDGNIKTSFRKVNKDTEEVVQTINTLDDESTFPLGSTVEFLEDPNNSGVYIIETITPIMKKATTFSLK